MNRYAAVGILLDASLGKTIMVLTLNARQIGDALNEIAAVAQEHAPEARITRLNGGERIDFPGGGGKIIVRSYRQGTSHVRADVLYLDEGVDPAVRVPDEWNRLTACLVRSPQSEVIRA